MGVLTQETAMPAIPSSSGEIVADIAARIASGEYGPGYELPSYRTLAELHSVSVSTAARAYVILRSMGLVRGVRGRGLFVVDRSETAGGTNGR